MKSSICKQAAAIPCGALLFCTFLILNFFVTNLHAPIQNNTPFRAYMKRVSYATTTQKNAIYISMLPPIEWQGRRIARAT